MEQSKRKMTAGALAVVSRRGTRKSAAMRKLDKYLDTWESVRVKRFGNVKDEPPAQLDQGVELRGWNGLPSDVLVLVLKYCLTPVPYREIVSCTGGLAYGPQLQESRSLSSSDILWSEAESAEDERLRDSWDRGEAPGLEYTSAWTLGCERARRILQKHKEEFADVRALMAAKRFCPYEDDEDEEDGEEGAGQGAQGRKPELPFFTFTTIVDARAKKHGDPNRYHVTLLPDGEWKIERVVEEGDTFAAAGLIVSHNAMDTPYFEAVAKQRMCRSDREQHRAAREQYEARAQLKASIEATWEIDEWTPAHILCTCKAWRAAVVEHCPHILAYATAAAMSRWKRTPMLSRLPSVHPAARACLGKLRQPATYNSLDCQAETAWGDDDDSADSSDSSCEASWRFLAVAPSVRARSPVECAVASGDEFVSVMDAVALVQQMLLCPRLETLRLGGVLPTYLLFAMGGLLPSLNGISRADLPLPPLCLNLRELTVIHSSLEHERTPASDSSPFCDALRGCPRLESIQFNRSYWTDNTVLAALGRHCPKLSSICMVRCFGVSHIGLRALLQGCRKLTSLSISCVDTTEAFFKVLGDHATELLELEAVESNTPITMAGASYLGKCWKLRLLILDVPLPLHVMEVLEQALPTCEFDWR